MVLCCLEAQVLCLRPGSLKGLCNSNVTDLTIVDRILRCSWDLLEQLSGFRVTALSSPFTTVPTDAFGHTSSPTSLSALSSIELLLNVAISQDCYIYYHCPSLLFVNTYSVHV